MTVSDEKSVPLSKVKSALLVLGSCSFVALGLWMAFLSDAEIEAQRRYNNPVFVHGIGWAAVVFATLCGSIGIRKMLDRKPGLVLSNAGLTDNSSGLSAGFIPWTDISGFSVYTVQKQKLLVVLLNNPERYISMGGVLRRNINRVNYKMAGSPISITSNSLKIKFDDLLRVCGLYFSRYGSLTQQGAPADVPASGASPLRPGRG